MGFVAELAEVRERLCALGQRFDPDVVSAADAEKVLEEARKISNCACVDAFGGGAGGRCRCDP